MTHAAVPVDAPYYPAMFHVQLLNCAIAHPSLCPPSSFSQGYHMQTARDMRPQHSVTLDPAAFHPPPFRSRNQSYMRAVSTLSQASCVSQVSLKHPHGTGATPGGINDS